MVVNFYGSIYFCHKSELILSTKNKFINGYLMR